MSDKSKDIIFRPNLIMFIVNGFLILILTVLLLFIRGIPLKHLFLFIPILLIGIFFMLSFFSQYVYVKYNTVVIESILSMFLRHKFQFKVNIKDIVSLRHVVRSLYMGDYLEIQTNSGKVQISSLFFKAKDFKKLISLLTSLAFLRCDNDDASKGPYTIWYFVGVILAATILAIIFLPKSK